jgi:hypothetical protein
MYPARTEVPRKRAVVSPGRARGRKSRGHGGPGFGGEGLGLPPLKPRAERWLGTLPPHQHLLPLALAFCAPSSSASTAPPLPVLPARPRPHRPDVELDALQCLP